MPYCQLYYHLVWATKGREPLVTLEREPSIYGFLRAKAIGLGGVVFALNGVEDHVHLVASIPPRIAVATFIGQVKGVASARFNKSSPYPVLYWQEEYGAFTFDGKRLPNVVAYVEKQKEHHVNRMLIPVLERTDDQPVGCGALRESSALYGVGPEEHAWWDEMLNLG
ncbi:MAG: IS200/IS605 family transposase [Candidatus Promineofilum sp.]|nr:IS200/IS605 family transposase [Promineifilum sp.]